SHRKRSVRDALERFLSELEAQRRASPHTVSAYRREVARVLDRAGGAGTPVPASAWTRELLERSMRELYRDGLAAASAARALAAWRSFSRLCMPRSRRSIATAPRSVARRKVRPRCS